jgi:ribosomal protein S18 acetylase RimI-like enzyme
MKNSLNEILYTLRPATADDYDFLFHLIEVCLKEYVEAIWGWDEVFQRNHFAEYFDVNGCQIVQLDGRDAGQLTVVEGDGDLYISGIYLLPEFQNKGQGSILVREVMARAEESGRAVTLQVLKANKSARRLYEKLGFQVTAERDTHYVMSIHYLMGIH